MASPTPSRLRSAPTRSMTLAIAAGAADTVVAGWSVLGSAADAGAGTDQAYELGGRLADVRPRRATRWRQARCAPA